MDSVNEAVQRLNQSIDNDIIEDVLVHYIELVPLAVQLWYTISSYDCLSYPRLKTLTQSQKWLDSVDIHQDCPPSPFVGTHNHVLG